jgi:hypothetical protein
MRALALHIFEGDFMTTSTESTLNDETEHALVEQILESSRSRKHFLTGAAAAAAAGLVPGATLASGLKGGRGRARGRRRMQESAASILNIAATAETAAVTALYNVHVAVGKGKLNTSGVAVPANMLVSIVRAALREEQDHLSFLMGAGAKPLYTSFSFPANIFTKATDTLTFFEAAETIFVAAYMAANREFAYAGHNNLAQYAYQIGGVESEHRALMRAGLGQMPANNKSFETNLYKKVSEAAAELGKLGIFKPGMTYPGAGAVDTILSTTVTKDVTAGVVQRKP